VLVLVMAVVVAVPVTMGHRGVLMHVSVPLPVEQPQGQEHERCAHDLHTEDRLVEPQP
jgi:hypothetical protein